MHTLTATQLRLLSMCQRRVWMDKYGNREDQINVSPVVSIPFMAGVRHEEDIHDATAPNRNEVMVTSWQEMVDATRDAMDNNRNVIGAALEAEVEIKGKAVRLVGRIDRLQYSPNGSHYPIEIKQYETLREADLLQLDFYCYLVGQVQDKIPHGAFWLGSEAKTVRHEFSSERFGHALDLWCSTIEQQDEPQVVYRPHCRTCHWHDSCVSDLKQKRSIQLLYRIRHDSIKALADKAIHTLDQFALLTLDDIRQIRGIKTTAERHLAHAKAFINNEPIVYQDMPDIVAAGGTMFDLETLVYGPDEGHPWSLGWCDTDGDTHIAIVNAILTPKRISLADNLTVHVVRHTDAAWYTLLDAIGDLDTPIYHWTSFDAGVMAKTAPDEVKELLLPRMHDLYKTFVDTVQLPIRSYSIKHVAAYFGFQWQGYDQWDAAYRDYQLWTVRFDEDALHRACEYQRDDVLALVTIWQWMMASGK